MDVEKGLQHAFARIDDCEKAIRRMGQAVGTMRLEARRLERKSEEVLAAAERITRRLESFRQLVEDKVPQCRLCGQAIEPGDKHVDYMDGTVAHEDCDSAAGRAIARIEG